MHNQTLIGVNKVQDLPLTGSDYGHNSRAGQGTHPGDLIDVGHLSLLFSFQCKADTLLNSPEF